MNTNNETTGVERPVSAIETQHQLGAPTSFGSTSEEALVRLAVGGARDEYRLRRYEEVVDRLGPIITDAGVAEPPSRLAIARAAAYALFARAKAKLGDDRAAAQARSRAIELWNRHQSDLEGQDYSDLGVALYLAGRAGDAVPALRKALGAILANPPETHRYLALALKNCGEAEEAERTLRRALEVEPEDDLARVTLAELIAPNNPAEASTILAETVLLLANENRLEDALSAAATFHSIFPEDAGAAFLNGEILRLVGRDHEAIAAFEGALQLGGDRGPVLASKGAALVGLQRYEEALGILEESTDLAPQLAFGWGTRARVLSLLERLEEAAGAYGTALELEPQLEWAREELAETLRLLGRYDESLEVLDEGIAARPNSAFLLGTKGQVLAMRGDSEGALKLIEQALALEPSFLWLHISQAEILAGEGHFHQALRALDRPPVVQPADNALVDTMRGRILLAQGKGEEAASAFKRAADFQSSDVIFGELGRALLALDRHDEALTAFGQALSLNPRNPMAQAGRGEVCRRLGQFQEALKALDKALAIAGDDAYVLGTKGQVLAALERHDEAIESFGAATQLDPSLAWAQSGLVVELATVGREKDSIEVLRAMPVEEPAGLEAKAELLLMAGLPAEALAAVDETLELTAPTGARLAIKGRALGELRKLQDSVDALREARELDPSSDIKAQLAESLRLVGEYGETLQLVEDVLSREPDYVFALGTKSQALASLGRLEEALEVVDSAVKVDPTYVFGFYTKAQILRELDRPDEASASIEDALKINPQFVGALALKVQTLRDHGDFDGAFEVLDEALTVSPDDPFCIALKGQLFRLQNQHEHAAALLQRAVELDSTMGWAYGELAEALRSLNRDAEAQEALESALEIDPNDAFALGTKGQILRERDDKGALPLLQRAVEIDPGSAWIHAELGAALFAASQTEKALLELDTALDLEPGNFLGLAYKAECLLQLGREEDALAVAERALLLSPDDPFVLGTKASALASLNRHSEAIVVIDVVLSAAPREAWALAAKSWILFGTADLQTALETIERSLDADDSQPWAHAQKGITLSYLGLDRADEAEGALRRAIEGDPDVLWWHTFLADVLRGKGQRDQAANEYRWVIDKARERTAVDVQTLWASGWCNYRLGNDDEASRLLVEALSLSSNLVSTQFDLGLVLVTSSPDEAALEEYRRGVRLSESIDDLLTRRGLLYFARFDLEEASNEDDSLREMDAVREARELLKDRLRACEQALANSREASGQPIVS